MRIVPSSPGPGKGDSGSSGGVEPLLALLHSDDLPRLRRVLQLMLSVHQAADGRVPWEQEEVLPRIRALGEELRGRAAGGAAAAAAAAMDKSGRPFHPPPGTDAAGAAGDGADGLEESDQDEELDALDGEKAAEVDPEVLEARKAKQLLPECMRMLKALSVSGGGKTD